MTEWAYPSGHQARGRVHPGGYQSITVTKWIYVSFPCRCHIENALIIHFKSGRSFENNPLKEKKKSLQKWQREEFQMLGSGGVKLQIRTLINLCEHFRETEKKKKCLHLHHKNKLSELTRHEDSVPADALPITLCCLSTIFGFTTFLFCFEKNMDFNGLHCR